MNNKNPKKGPFKQDPPKKDPKGPEIPYQEPGDKPKKDDEEDSDKIPGKDIEKIPNRKPGKDIETR